MTDHHESTKHLVDAVSLMTVAGTLIDMLPAIAALFSIVWSAIRIWETDTVKGWTGRRDQSE
jgi:hypothetical protein